MTTPAVLSDFTADLTNGATTPTRKNASMKRKQTLLSLLDALSELTKEENLDVSGNNQQPSFEADKDVPSVDEHLQVIGAESFNRFQKRINNLDKELRNFANAARQLGSSVGILSSSFHLRERLASILFLFRENAADLFPRKISRQPRDTFAHPNHKAKPPKTQNQNKPRKPARHKPPPHLRRPVIDEGIDPEMFPEQLESLAADVTTFLNCLNEFPEFTDEAVNSSISSFQDDLKYWASCLSAYKTQFRYPAVQRYIHDITSEMGEHIDSITSTLSMFIEIGVPTIRFAQKHGATNLLNLSTVATFFSAVTATTLQFSYGLTPKTPITDAVNCFWFASMVFSIAAAVNSLLGLTWKQAMYRSPGHRVPWWVLIWIKRSPLVFLVMAVACFSIGLCIFTYASNQSPVTSNITTVLTAFTSFGLAAVSTWFASERWIFLRHRGKKWLGDVLMETTDRVFELPGMGQIRRGVRWARRRLRVIYRRVKRTGSSALSLIRSSGHEGRGEDDEVDLEGALPFSAYDRERASPIRRFPSDTHSHSHSRSNSHTHIPTINEPRSSMGGSTTLENVSESEKHDATSPTNATPGGGPDTPTAPPRPKGKFATAVRSIMMLQSASAHTPLSPLSTLSAFSAKRSESSLTIGGSSEKRKRTADSVTALRVPRVAALVPKLKALEAVVDLEAHAALVRHLQFSPDGRFLATSSWDRTSVIFKVGDPFTSHRILAHPQGFVGQVAWSPNGNLLLTKLTRSIKVWTEDGVCKKTIDRPDFVESITWFPGGDAFMSVEGSVVTKLNLNGKILDTYHFHQMKLHDVAVLVTPDSQRLLGVGPALESPTGLQPSKSRAEKRLVVYNMETKQIENQTPVLNDVRDITLSRNGHVALVSYENKAPPQLWRIELVKDRENITNLTARLSLRHTYMPKFPVNFAGPSYFGGKNDQLVLCAGKLGDIHIWDRESAVLLHHVRAQVLGGDLTCIAWNHAAEDPFMFATGSHDGAVRIWTDPSVKAKRDKDQDQDRDNDANGYTFNVLERPRTRSPSPYLYTDMDRSESPSPQLDSPEAEAFENGGVPLPERERSISFVT